MAAGPSRIEGPPAEAFDSDSGVRLRFRPDRPVQRPFTGRGDAAVIGSFLHLAPASWLLPTGWWPSFCRAGVAVRCRVDESPIGRVAAKAAAALGHDPAAAREIAMHLQAAKYELTMQVFRAHRPGAWHPHIDVHGREHLDEALRSGRGAVLWVSHFVFNSSIAKIGLHQLGYRVAHLSRPEHGFSKTRLGIAALNPIRCRAEDAFLEERIVIDRARMTTTMRRMRSRLEENKTVSVTVGPWEGRQLAEIPLLGGYLLIATGAISLAHQCGTPLLPVFALRKPGTDEFALHIEAPLSHPAGIDKNRAVIAASRDYATRLEPYVRGFPEQWRGWSEWHLARDAPI
jgi:lauroyl/myristoyl acyltransferase